MVHSVRRLVMALGVVAAVVPGTASAGTVSRTSELTYQAAAGEVNDLIVAETTADLVFTENRGVPVAPGSGCRRGSSLSQVLCAKAPLGDVVRVRLGDGADRAQTQDGYFALIHGDAGDDLVTGAGRFDGGDGADDLSCHGGTCTMLGGAGPDRMRGLLDPKLAGGRGTVLYEDHIAGVAVTVDGVNDDGNGSDGPISARDNVTAVDRIEGTETGDFLTDGPGEDHVLIGHGGGDELRGGPGRDALAGGMGRDLLYGGDGDDALSPDNYAVAGPHVWVPGDTTSGGDGRDAVDYPRSSDLRISLDGVANDGTDADGDGVVEEGDNVLADVEDVHAGDGDDVIVGSAVRNSLFGGLGDDRLTGGAGADRLEGSYGEDKLDGGDHDDVLEGGYDADVLGGQGGLDRLNGGYGNDLLDGGASADVMAGGFGIDTVSYANRTLRVYVTMSAGANDGADIDGFYGADEGDDVRPDVENLVGGSNDDEIRGNAAANRLDGGSGGSDYLQGGDGNDVLDGGPGLNGDPASGDGGDDLILQGKIPNGNDGMGGGPGTDTVDYSARTTPVEVSTLDSLPGDGAVSEGENDNVRDDIEVVLGGSAADVLIGAPVDNRLVGGAGDDILDGGFGADDLAGGVGSDTVTYASRTGSVTADLDGLADDGTAADANAASVRDRVRTDVERLIGGSGADTLTGNAFANRLTGGGGPDVLTGGGAVDGLFGGSGDDDLFSRGDGAADTAACETGAADEVTADPADAVSGCEIVN